MWFCTPNLCLVCFDKTTTEYLKTSSNSIRVHGIIVKITYYQCYKTLGRQTIGGLGRIKYRYNYVKILYIK